MHSSHQRAPEGREEELAPKTGTQAPPAGWRGEDAHQGLFRPPKAKAALLWRKPGGCGTPRRTEDWVGGVVRRWERRECRTFA